MGVCKSFKCGKLVLRLDESFLVKEEQSPDETEDKSWDNKEAEDSGASKIRLFICFISQVLDGWDNKEAEDSGASKIRLFFRFISQVLDDWDNKEVEDNGA